MRSSRMTVGRDKQDVLDYLDIFNFKLVQSSVIAPHDIDNNQIIAVGYFKGFLRQTKETKIEKIIIIFFN